MESNLTLVYTNSSLWDVEQVELVTIIIAFIIVANTVVIIFQ